MVLGQGVHGCNGISTNIMMVVVANVNALGEKRKGAGRYMCSYSTVLLDECKLAQRLKYMSYTLCCMVLCNLCWELMCVLLVNNVEYNWYW